MPCAAFALASLATGARGQEPPPVSGDIDVAPPGNALAFGDRQGLDSAWGDPVHLVVWTDRRVAALEERVFTADVFGARVDGSGNVLDPTGFRIERDAGAPAVAFGDGLFLVVSSTASGVVARRLTPEGRSLDEAPIAVAPEGLATAVVWTGRAFLVLRELLHGLAAVRVDPTGEVTEALTSIAGTPVSRSSGLAAGSGQHLVAWVDGSGADQAIRAARIDDDGEPLDPDGFIVATGDRLTHVSVAPLGDGCSWRGRATACRSRASTPAAS